MHTMTAAAMAVSMLASPVAAGAPEIPTTPATIELVSATGTGCTAKNVDLAVLDDNSAFSVKYRNLAAITGPDTAVFGASKDCKLVARITAPEGYTYGTIYASDYFGSVDIKTNDAGLHRANISFADQAEETEYGNHPMVGPLEGDWFESDFPASATMQYAPCGKTRDFVLKTVLLMNGTNGAVNTLSMVPSDGGVSALHQLVWKKC